MKVKGDFWLHVKWQDIPHTQPLCGQEEEEVSSDNQSCSEEPLSWGRRLRVSPCCVLQQISQNHVQVCIFTVLLVAGLCRTSKMLPKDITSEDAVGSVSCYRCDPRSHPSSDWGAPAGGSHLAVRCVTTPCCRSPKSEPVSALLNPLHAEKWGNK